MQAAETENELAKAAYGKLRLHRRRRTSGLVQMMRNGDLDIFDGLAVAPLVLAEEVRLAAAGVVGGVPGCRMRR